MEIEKGTTLSGQFIHFEDDKNNPCSVRVFKEDDLRLTINAAFASFSQEQIRVLLPYLQSYAQSGTLEPTPQGGGLLEESIKNTASLIRQVEDQTNCIEEQKVDISLAISHISELEQLVREYRTLHHEAKSLENASQHHLWEECCEDVLYKTAQLLGEETKPPTPLQGGTAEKIYHRALETIREELTSFDPDGDCSNYDREQAVEEVLKIIGIAIGDEKVESDQDKLKQLLKDWRLFGQGAWESKHPDRLIFETDQFLGEEPK